MGVNNSKMMLMNAGKAKVAENSQYLATTNGGRWRLQSDFGMYVTGNQAENKCELTRHAGKLEHWYIEEMNGLIVFKTSEAPGKFLRADRSSTVDFADIAREWETWSPYKNDDGSWSFVSYHGSFLSAEVNVCTDKDIFYLSKAGRFWLSDW